MPVTLLGWMAMLGVDLLLHGAILAPWYVEPSPFLLPPERAFALIPLGYLALLLLAVLLVWLSARIGIVGWARGLRFGLTLGALIWGSLALGLLSISTASPSLMLGWFIGQTVQLGVAGMVVGAASGRRRLGRVFLVVLAFVVLCVLITVGLQSVGVVPTLHRAGP